jgi:hypothetical protein
MDIKPKVKPPDKSVVTQNKPPVRTKAPPGPKSARSKVTRATAIKYFCIECMGYNKHLVKACKVEACPLWSYRTGSGYEDTDAVIFMPKVWPKDQLATETPPEDNR